MKGIEIMFYQIDGDTLRIIYRGVGAKFCNTAILGMGVGVQTLMNLAGAEKLAKTCNIHEKCSELNKQHR